MIQLCSFANYVKIVQDLLVQNVLKFSCLTTLSRQHFCSKQYQDGHYVTRFI